MPTGNAIADSMTQNADRRGENAVNQVVSPGFLPNVNITPTTDPSSYIKQSQDILSTGFQTSGVPQLFKNVAQTGARASAALDIIDEQYKQAELKKLPLDALQAEVDDMQVRRQRVLPEILSDPSITDYNAKLRIASRIQSMFDAEIEKTLTRREQLETAAASRAKMKTDTLRAEASMIDKQLANDQFLLSSGIDLFQAGTGSLQDILKMASSMQDNIEKAKKSGGGDNPFLGTPGQDFSDEEVSLFLKADKNFGRLDISDSVGKNYKALLNARYYQWQQTGKPVRRFVPGKAVGAGVFGPSRPDMFQTVSGDDDGVNTFPDPPNNSLISIGADGEIKIRGVGEDPS